jgi:hypothetical protein
VAQAQPGQALSFDGANDYADCGNPAALQISGSTLTVEAWMMATGWETSAYDGYILAKESHAAESPAGYSLSVGNNGAIVFRIGSGSAWQEVSAPVSTLALNRWYHLAAVFDGTRLALYVNGVETASAAFAGSLASTSRSLLIGSASQSVGSDHFMGQIDEVRVWSSARSLDQLLEYMFRPAEGTESGLAACFAFDEGSGSGSSDRVSSLPATLVNMASPWVSSGARLSEPATAHHFRRAGTGLAFDGSNEYAQIADHDSLDMNAGQDFSIECWVRPLNTQPNAGAQLSILEKWNGVAGTPIPYALRYVRSSGTVQAVRSNGSTSATLVSTTSIRDNLWHHLAFVKSGTTLTLYIDGRPEASASDVSGSTANASNLFIAARGNLSLYFGGDIDELRIWRRALSTQEIRSRLYRTCLPGESRLAAQYRFDDAAGSSLSEGVGGLSGSLHNLESSDWISAAGREAAKPWVAGGNWSSEATWLLSSIPSGSNAAVHVLRNVSLDGNITLALAMIEDSASLALTTGNTLTLSRHLYVYGAATGEGNLTFGGTRSQILSGSGSVSTGTLRVNNNSGMNLEMNVTAENALTLSRGTLSIGSNTLTLNGVINRTSGSLLGGSSSNITIGGTAAAATLPAVTLNTLKLDRPDGLFLGGDVLIEGELRLEQGRLDVSTYTLSLDVDAPISGSFSSSTMIIAEEGYVTKDFEATGAFFFPIGDTYGYYSPINLDFVAGDFSSATVQVQVKPFKHPDNYSSTHFLNRYWSLMAWGISDYTCDIVARYHDNDIEGTEGDIYGLNWNIAASEWGLLEAAVADDNLLLGRLYELSDVTGGEDVALALAAPLLEALAGPEGTRLTWKAFHPEAASWEILRSADGESWQSLARPASPDLRSFDDQEGRSGEAFYRLRQHLSDGSFLSSNVASARLPQQQTEVYPQPARSGLFFRGGPPGPLNISLFSAQGMQVRSFDCEELPRRLEVGDLPAGLYVLVLTMPDGRKERLRWVKE